MADMQRQEMNERTSRRMQQWQITGRAMGGKAPYGYRKEGHKLIQVPEEQKVVNAMMRLRESGYTCRAILTWLQRHKIKPRVKWHLKTVQRIVRRETKRAQQKLG
jgi:DNA invertase Pin-like site-specific DNA recombinase